MGLVVWSAGGVRARVYVSTVLRTSRSGTETRNRNQKQKRTEIRQKSRQKYTTIQICQTHRETRQNALKTAIFRVFQSAQFTTIQAYNNITDLFDNNIRFIKHY